MQSLSQQTQSSHSDPSSAQVGGQADFEAACTQLCVEFANALDADDYVRVVDVFTPDATIVATTGEAVQGRDAILASLSTRPAMRTRHCCSNIRITLNADGSATGLCYVVCFKNFGEEAARGVSTTPMPIVADYHDTYVFTEEGWRISERRIAMIFNPDLAN